MWLDTASVFLTRQTTRKVVRLGPLVVVGSCEYRWDDTDMEVGDSAHHTYRRATFLTLE